MAGIYLDTSALGRVLLEEPDYQRTAGALGEFDRYVSSRLLRVELRRLANRFAVLARADRLLADVALLPLPQSLLDAAEIIEPTDVATLDAIHLASAVRMQEEGVVSTIMTYDRVLAAGARANGLDVLSP